MASEAEMRSLPLKFQIGARTLAAIPKRLVHVALSLDAVLSATRPDLPPLPSEADGYLVTSLPETMHASLDGHGLLAFVRQRYARYHVDLAAGEATWLAGLSSGARSGIRRKARKLASANGGRLDVRSYRGADGLAAFYPLARAVSARTYQERLLDAGLPEDAESVRDLQSAAAEDRLRAWLLVLDDAPIAYLCCTADGESLRYDHVGHDPAYKDLSPGAVLQAEALRALFADGDFARFDFTEGEGQHKRQFSTGGTACVDVLLLRSTLANRAAIAALQTFDTVTATAKRVATRSILKRLADRIRR